MNNIPTSAIETSAAHNLVGIELEGGWRVVEKLTKRVQNTGSFFSVCYKVELHGKEAFLKAFNFTSFFNAGTGTFMDTMKRMVVAHTYERDLSAYCRGKHVSKISVAVTSGEANVTGYGAVDIVPYLIFEWAEGDIRDLIADRGPMDSALLFKSLHSIATGLKQLHQINVSHNDLKPSNVLVFGPGEHKICDLGSSVCAALPSPNDKLLFGGDYNYAPPEILYHADCVDRASQARLTDLYLFGSMFAFYFTNLSMTALLTNHLPLIFRTGEWTGTWVEVKEYLLPAFSEALDDLSGTIPLEFRADVVLMVEKLCFPFPERRGLGFASGVSRYELSLERIVTKLDVLIKRAELSAIRSIKVH
jgi:serine/threonine protein kinase